MAEVEDRDGVAPSESRLAASYREGVERLATAIAEVVEREGEWGARVSAGLGAGLRLLAADPELARLLLVEPLAISGPLRAEHECSLGRLAEALRPPTGLTGDEPVSDEILRLQAGGLASYLSGRVLAGEGELLAEDHGALLRYLLAFRGSPA